MLTKKFLRKVGYYERRFARRGDLKIIHYRQPTLKQTAQMIQHLGDIEKRSWMASDANAHMRFATTEGQQQWTRLVYRSLSPHDQLDCWIMMFEGQPVSFCFTLTDLPVRYIIANSYDEQVKEHRTGSILFRYMIEDGINRGVRRFDYGDGEIHYKQLWGASYQDWLDTYLIVPNSVLGSVARPVRALKRLIRPEKVDIDPALDSILANTQLNQTTNSHRAENEALVEN